MISRRIPGAVGGRPARTFLIASAQYLEAPTGFGLGANDPFYLVGWSRRDATTANQYLVMLGVAGSVDNYRLLRTGSGNLVAESRDAAATNAASSAASTYVSGDGWHSWVAEWAGVSSRRLVLDGTLYTSTTTRTVGAAPTAFRIGRSLGDTLPVTGAINSVAIFAGTASDSLIALHRRGVHPTQLPGTLLECWDLDRVGPIVGLVRGTVLTPTNGGSLTGGPPQVQGPPRRVWLPVGTAGGAPTSHTLTADSGTVAVTGTAATLTKAYRVAADTASAAITGTAASLTKAYRVAADAGSAAITGTAATLKRAFRIGADSGATTITGTDATLAYAGGDKTLTADPGTFTIAGTTAALTRGYRLVADSVALAVAGTIALLARLFRISADSGSVAATGTDATLDLDRRVTADPGAVTVTGADATLAYSGGPPPVKKTMMLMGVQRTR